MVYTLQLLHAADQEGGVPALDDAPRFSAVLNALREQDADGDGNVDFANTLTLSSGDAIIPGVFFGASEDAFGGEGRGDILIQNELGFQAIAFGNHEFDRGTELLADLIGGAADDPATPDVDESFIGAQFPYLSSNLDFSTDENLADLVVADDQAPQANGIAATTVIDVNGELIGVVGATTPTLPVISSPDGVTVNPQPFDGNPTPEQLDALAAEIQTDVNELLTANPDINKVVLLSHMQQLSIERELATRLSNVDIIVGGGSNTRLVDENDRLRDGDTAQGTYPEFLSDADGNPVAVVNTDGNYKYVGRLVIDFNDNGVIIPETYDSAVSGAYATDAQGVADLGAEALVDPEIQAIVDQLEAVIVASESNVFGVSDVYLDGRRGSVRIQETNLGNLTADANLAIAREADPEVVISLKNGGGIRDDIGQVIVPPGGTGDPEFLPNEEIPGVKPEGGISETDIANTLRFNNGLSLLTVTAEELLALMEHAVGASSLDDSNTQGRFPQIAGFSFSFDLTQPEGERVVSLAIEDEAGNDIDVVVQDGEIVGDPARTFRMVTLGFLAGGGDGYPFPTGEAANRVDLEADETATPTGDATFAADGTEQDALAEYLLDNFAPDAGTPFSNADTPREEDTRIQNLAFRADTVIDGLEPASSADFLSFAFAAQVAAAAGLSLPYTPVEVGGLNLGQLYDEGFYLSENADVAAAVAAGAFASGYDHFSQFGFLEGRDASILFTEAEYLAANPDVAAAVDSGVFSSGLQHFALAGHLEGRNPNSLFSQADYLTNNPDVAAAVADGLLGSGFEHFIESGALEGRLPEVSLFQEDIYLAQNTDVAAAVGDGAISRGLEHFVQFGAAEQRDPSDLFSNSAYLAANPDVASAVDAGAIPSGFVHYAVFGRGEGRAIA